MHLIAIPPPFHHTRFLITALEPTLSRRTIRPRILVQSCASFTPFAYIPSIPFCTVWPWDGRGRGGGGGEDGAENDLSETWIEEVWRPGRNFGRVQYFRIRRGGGVPRHAMPSPAVPPPRETYIRDLWPRLHPLHLDQINSLGSIFYRFPRNNPTLYNPRPVRDTVNYWPPVPYELYESSFHAETDI